MSSALVDSVLSYLFLYVHEHPKFSYLFSEADPKGHRLVFLPTVKLSFTSVQEIRTPKKGIFYHVWVLCKFM